MPKTPALTAADIEWEEPPRQGRASSEEMNALVETVKSMVPALRERLESWALLDAFPKPQTASARALALRKLFGNLDTIEARLQFRGAKMLDGTSKLYVRLRAV